MPRDLAITALYTAETWAWGGLPCAQLFASAEGRRVFDVTNAALAIARVIDPRPQLRHALLQRHAMIDRIVRSSPTRRVIELAVGLSRRGATLSADPTFDYIEIDLPHVIAHKRRLLERSAAGRVVLARPNLQLVAGDVLVDALPARTPAVVVAEGLAMYLAGDARLALFARVRALGDVELVFDLTPASDEPPPGAVGRALERAMKRFTGGQAFERDARTRDDVVAELGAAGFADARAIAARDVARDWQLPFADRATPVVIFVARATRS